MEIKGTIDHRHTRIVSAMLERDDALLPKVMAAKEGKTIVVMEACLASDSEEVFHVLLH